ncbi:hypothetical protein [Streptomyces sp. NPDC093589]|uniref:hypothetical protein n=1 Tax=Streptomyces sp. NPDC093589 TaxID=3366043 RepID=UPI00381734A2
MNGTEFIKTCTPSGGAPEETVKLDWEFVERATISVHFADGNTVRYTDSDLFDCLVGIRNEIEQYGLILCCNGSRRDCYPSRMSREMGGAQRLMLLRFGELPTIRSMVDIFESADASQIGTPEEQRIYYQEWLTSIM